MNNDNDPMPSFDEWFAKYRHLMPEGFSEVLEEHYSHLNFIFFWKRYEHVLTPKMCALLVKQYPTVAAADESFAKSMCQCIEERIFETAEFAWEIVESNAAGKHPSEVFETVYPMAMKDMNSPGHSKELYDLDNPSDDFMQFGRQRALQMQAEHNEDTKRAIAFITNFNKEVIAVLQEDLLELLPELLDMSADWWKVYKFLLICQCHSWKNELNLMEHLISLGMSGEWMDKDFRERDVEIQKRTAVEWQRNYGHLSSKEG